MRSFVRFALPVVLISALVVSAGSATAAGTPDVHSPNMKHIGFAGNPGTTNSDLAFWGHLLYEGSYTGFRILDISDPRSPRVLSSVKCNGGQGDVSVWKNLLFVSMDQDQTKPTCPSDKTPGGVLGFEGIRVYDVSDPTHPSFVTAVPTDCGSHTNTLNPDSAHGVVYLYVESYPLRGQGQDCNSHNYDSVVKVPLGNPKKASVSTFDTSPSEGCHDVTVFQPLHIAAAACISEGQIWDISDPGHPKVIQHLYNPQLSVWHSAAFSWDGKTVAFGDENQSYQACQGQDSPTGNIWFYRVHGKTADSQPAGRFTIPRVISGDPQTECTAHNFDVVPVQGRNILVSAFYSGGATVVVFTDPAKPKEIAYYQIRGNVPADEWSTYWYNGHIYANDINRGIDVFSLSSPLVAGAKTFPYLNPQTELIAEQRAVLH